MLEKLRAGGPRKLRITFHIHYITNHSEERLWWYDQEGNDFEMSPTSHHGLWQLQLDWPIEETAELRYNYRLVHGSRLLRTEPLIQHTLRLHLPTQCLQGEIAIYDRWIEPSPWHKYTDAPLANLLNLPDISRYRIPTYSTISGDAFAFDMQPPLNEELLMVGAIPSCGSWDTERAIPLSLTRNGYVLQFPERKRTEYKLILKQPDGKIIWEEGKNRLYEPDQDEVFTLRYERPPFFEKITPRERRQITGTAVPIFSLRSERSYGVGDFSDVSSLLDWMQINGQNILQLLPFYDTTFTRSDQDSYPYSAISTYGIHPLYMDVRQLPYYHTSPLRPEWETRASKLNQLTKLNYSAVLKLKEEVMDYCYDQWYHNSYKEDKSFSEFIEREKEKLLSYALFCTIRDKLPLTPVEQYPPYPMAREEWIEKRSCLGTPAEKEVLKHAFRQYHLYKQLEQTSLKAAFRNILLKGDLPIGVKRNSEDVWVAPHLFNLDKEAGAPPDIFSELGQDWLFPTYNWEAMREEDYEWWRGRLSTMNRYLDAIRIDHILGFFRIWSIPAYTSNPSLGYYVPAQGYSEHEVHGIKTFFNKDNDGSYHPLLAPEHRSGWTKLSEEEQIRYHALKENYYHRRNEALWRETAIERLSHIISASEMLICAEDLGVLTESITEVLSSFEILSLEVLRMPKQLGQKFIHPDSIPELSVLTTSTHDMDSLRAWWSELTPADRCELARLYNFTNEITPAGLIKALHRTRALLLILPLQDWFTLTEYGSSVLAKEERINKPDDPNHIWCYRMYGTISQLPRLHL